MLPLLKMRDNAKKDWLKSFINSEIFDVIRRDRNDMMNHTTMHSDEIYKL